ncbi:motile sperm domain-containing protein 1-like [Arapaima gigas]
MQSRSQRQPMMKTLVLLGRRLKSSDVGSEATGVGDDGDGARGLALSPMKGREAAKGSTREKRMAQDAPSASWAPQQLPVFLFPTELVFHSQTPSTHRKVLTLYNPYNFPLHFKMLCTAPSRYTVLEAEGNVRERSCVDIVVRHRDVSPRNWGRRDRFRLEVRGGGQSGRRDVWAELRAGHEGDEDTPGRRAGPPRSLVTTLPEDFWHPNMRRKSSLVFLYMLVGIVCVAGLMLPMESESNAVVPAVLHVSITQKLVCAYILGLLTMVFLR